VAEGVISAGRLHQSRQQGRLGQIYPGWRALEIALRRRPDAIGPVAKVPHVQIEFQDLPLAVAGIDLEGQDHVLQLPVQAAIIAPQVDLFGELFGQCAATLDGSSCLDVSPGGAERPQQIDAMMAVEVLVLGYRKRERRALGLQPRDAWPFLSRGWEDGLSQHAWGTSRA
jgi:hypothetical protein